MLSPRQTSESIYQTGRDQAPNHRQHFVPFLLHQLRRQRLEIQPQQRLGVRPRTLKCQSGNSAEKPSSV